MNPPETNPDFLPDNNQEVYSSENSSAQLNDKVDKLGNFSLNLLRSIALWRLAGYLLLFLFLMDLAEILIPPRFLDPDWEFNVLGQIVERVPIILLAYLLIFYGGKYLRKAWENIFLVITSWSTILVGLLFILAVPLGVINTIRINNINNTNITKSTNERLEILKTVETRMREVKTNQEMQQLIARLNQGNAPVIENQEQFNLAKTNLQNFINQNKDDVNNQANETQKQSFRRLLKRSVKWNTGALVTGVLFLSFWKMTKWARSRESYE